MTTTSPHMKPIRTKLAAAAAVGALLTTARAGISRRRQRVGRPAPHKAVPR